MLTKGYIPCIIHNTDTGNRSERQLKRSSENTLKKLFKKSLKKVLTKRKGCVKMIKLSERQQGP